MAEKAKGRQFDPDSGHIFCSTNEENFFIFIFCH
jgi:hypothetical protein